MFLGWDDGLRNKYSIPNSSCLILFSTISFLPDNNDAKFKIGVYILHTE